MSEKDKVIVLVHWRIKPEKESVDEFLNFWKTEARIEDRTGLIGEFLCETMTPKEFSYITWHLDSESLGDHKSFINVATWADEQSFNEQVANKFNDDCPMKSFEKYRRRRIVLRPKCERIGKTGFPKNDSSGVQ